MEGTPIKPFKDTTPFFRKIIIENAFNNNSRFCHQKYARNKTERNYGPQGLQIAVFQQS